MSRRIFGQKEDKGKQPASQIPPENEEEADKISTKQSLLDIQKHGEAMQRDIHSIQKVVGDLVSGMETMMSHLEVTQVAGKAPDNVEIVDNQGPAPSQPPSLNPKASSWKDTWSRTKNAFKSGKTGRSGHGKESTTQSEVDRCVLPS